MKLDNKYVGQRFGRLVVQGASFRYHRGGAEKRWAAVCRCDCGRYHVAFLRLLEDGRTRSCGCLSRDLGKERRKVPEGLRWLRLRAKLQLAKCSKPYATNYKHYGGRGIEFRFASPSEAALYYATLPGCSPDMEIDRIDNNGHYERGNVRFVSHTDNVNNRRLSLTTQTCCGVKLNTDVTAGSVYGELTTLGVPFRTRETESVSTWRVVCKCSCGNTQVHQWNHLRGGASRSCGSCVSTIQAGKSITA